MIKKTSEEKDNLLTIEDMCIFSGISLLEYYRYIKKPEETFEKEARYKCQRPIPPPKKKFKLNGGIRDCTYA